MIHKDVHLVCCPRRCRRFTAKRLGIRGMWGVAPHRLCHLIWASKRAEQNNTLPEDSKLHLNLSQIVYTVPAGFEAGIWAK